MTESFYDRDEDQELKQADSQAISDPYRPSYLPPDEHLDAFPEETLQPIKEELMNEWARAYQKRIERETPDDKILTAEQEAELSGSIQAGLAAEKQLSVDHKLTEGQKSELSQVVEAGKAARDTLVVANLRLAAWFARATMDLDKQSREAAGRPGKKGAIFGDLSKLSGGGLDYNDRMQIATLGLMKAAEKYTAEARFTTYAMYYMESELARELSTQSGPFRLPIPKSEELQRFYKTKQILSDKLGREPALSEVAMSLEIPFERADQLEQLSASNKSISLEAVDKAIAEQSEDSQAEDKGIDRLSLADRLPDLGVDNSLEDEVMFNELGFRLDQVISSLNPREQQVIEMRFGLVTGYPMTLGELGDQMGVTKERIRQIESKALAKMRYPFIHHTIGLGDFLDVGVEETPRGNYRGEITLGQEIEGKLGLSKPTPYFFESRTPPPANELELAKQRHKKKYTIEEMRQMRDENRQ